MEDRKTITLIVTERCNLSCIYCYEPKKSSSDMSFETAKIIIDKELNNSDYSKFTIEFFGGEPLLNFDLIKNVFLYVNEKYKSKDVHFFATTNGTCVHGEIEHWLRQNVHRFTLGLSFDGIKEAQDTNRSNSFDRVNLALFKELYPTQPLKMTVSEKSLPLFFESVKYLTEQGFDVSCNLAYMVDWLNDNNRVVLEQQLNLLINYYIDNPKLKKCSMLNYDISILSHPVANDKIVKKFCGCGTNMSVYGVDGKCYPCQLFSPVAADKRAIQSKDFYIKRDIPKEKYPQECNECFFERICSFCLGSNYLSTGNMFVPDFERCKLNRVIFQANAKLKALEWERGLLETDDEQGTLRSILTILA